MNVGDTPTHDTHDTTATAMALSSVFVVTNSLRLRRFQTQ